MMEQQEYTLEGAYFLFLQRLKGLSFHEIGRLSREAADSRSRSDFEAKQDLFVPQRGETAVPEILLVEDDEDIRRDISEMLEEGGYRVAVARDGKEALDYLRAEAAPKLILLDLMMPGMNGWQFRSAQQQDPELALIPVVVLTGTTNPHETTATLRANGCIPKPFGLDRLFEEVQRYC